MGIARPCNVPSLVQVRAQRGWVQRELSCRGFSWRRRLTVLAGRAEGVQEGGTRPGKGCGRSQARRSGALSPDLRVSATDTAELSRPSRRQEEGARKTSTLGNSVSGVRLPERSLGVCQGSVPDPASRRPALGPPAAAASPRLAPRSPRLRAAGTAPPRAALSAPAPPRRLRVGRETRARFTPSWGVGVRALRRASQRRGGPAPCGRLWGPR